MMKTDVWNITAILDTCLLKKVYALYQARKFPCSVHWSPPQEPAMIHRKVYLMKGEFGFEVLTAVLLKSRIFYAWPWGWMPSDTSTGKSTIYQSLWRNITEDFKRRVHCVQTRKLFALHFSPFRWHFCQALKGMESPLFTYHKFGRQPCCFNYREIRRGIRECLWT
jgi:hypothetical protein